MGPLGKKPAPPAAKAAALAADTAAAPPKPAAAAPAPAPATEPVAVKPDHVVPAAAPAPAHAPAPAPVPLPAATAAHPQPAAAAHVTGAVHLPPSGLPVPSAKMTLTVAVPTAVSNGKPPAAAAELKHYEQVTQAMVMKDRRVPYKSKAKPMRSFNPNEVTIPENLKADEKDKLLQEIKKKWQADFGQRIRYEEANRALRDQVNDLKAKLATVTGIDPDLATSDELLGGTAGPPSKPGGGATSPTRAGPANGANGDVAAATGAKGARQRVRKNDEQYAKLEAQLHRAAGKIRAYEAQKRVGAALRGSDPPPEEESVLRQTNMIVVLTKRNKELVLERKKMDELLHAKTVTAENEVRRCEKLERELESTRNKYTRDRTKLEAAMGEMAKAKAAVDDRVRELERRLEAAARLRIAIEHQNAGLRDKLDSLMIDYSDVVNAVPIEDLEAATTSPRTERKKAPAAAAAAVPLALSPIPPGGEDDAMKQARLAFEYEAWVKKKSEEAGHAAAHPAAGAGARGSRKPTKAAADEAKNLEMQRIEQERQEAETARKRQEEELARLEEERKKQEAENEARLQREAEEREKERQRRAEEELAKQEAEAAAAAAAAAEAKKKKKRWGGG
ncbi:hypothetical protein AMAG_07117 [Allomyces macrogynus ATCC 38327]|uniref:Uncharacterized protein n=1 Tax=Allomyces macrogynus (strain ATCC 38327) TaxID=578462 RepID=A0A0L0SH64_ALLM3|nr:hypothetical protein AMAG_07117 [Allomyces macrogynus ATCC 38327]|eukprot:KNE61841.1 hypothetical protein AMAG_07117 [Allomyces macrogynus ATCC 38327]